jgi:hypothetical protein
MACMALPTLAASSVIGRAIGLTLNQFMAAPAPGQQAIVRHHDHPRAGARRRHPHRPRAPTDGARA